MGFLIVWIAVVASAGALLAGWALGPQALMLPAALSPETAAYGLLVAIVLVDLANSLWRRFRR